MRALEVLTIATILVVWGLGPAAGFSPAWARSWSSNIHQMAPIKLSSSIVPPCQAGRVALVTGAGKGLGQAIAIALAEAGHRYDSQVASGSASTCPLEVPGGAMAISHVICAGRSAASCADVVEYINTHYPSPAGCFLSRGSSVVVDVRNSDEVSRAVQESTQKFGRIDILVNNAGITKDKLLLAMAPQDWLDVIDSNLNSVFYFSRAVARGMVTNRWGRIINIASISGLGGQMGQTNYSSSKAAVIGFTKSLAKELAGSNVTVNAVAPGFIESEMTKKLRPVARDEGLKRVPMARFGLPAEVASLVAFIASNEASYMSGTVAVVDGGLMFGMA